MSKKSILDLFQSNKPLNKKVPFWFMRQAGRYLPEYLVLRHKREKFLDLCLDPKLATEITLQPIHRFDMDAAILFSDILIVPYALGIPVDFKDGFGPKLKSLDHKDDIKKINQKKFLDLCSPVFETVQNISKKLSPNKTLIGFSGAPWTLATYMIEGQSSKDFKKTKLWAYNDPYSFQKLIDILIESIVLYVCEQIKNGAEIIQIFDSWAGVLSCSQLDLWSINPLKSIIEQVKKYYPHIPFIVFPKGVGVNYYKYDFCDGLGFDSHTPRSWILENIPNKIVIQGNLDPLLLVTGGTSMEEETINILNTFSKRKFIFNLGHGVLPETPIDHMARLCQLIRQYKKYE
ncbi:MAG: uroporphyrinogen decarboxylase [Alphaproteobacteria bacterium]|nr:uroporphyrinogen decarboxylase [Alphaproteobacteria bacterium]